MRVYNSIQCPRTWKFSWLLFLIVSNLFALFILLYNLWLKWLFILKGPFRTLLWRYIDWIYELSIGWMSLWLKINIIKRRNQIQIVLCFKAFHRIFSIFINLVHISLWHVLFKLWFKLCLFQCRTLIHICRKLKFYKFFTLLHVIIFLDFFIFDWLMLVLYTITSALLTLLGWVSTLDVWSWDLLSFHLIFSWFSLLIHLKVILVNFEFQLIQRSNRNWWISTVRQSFILVKLFIGMMFTALKTSEFWLMSIFIISVNQLLIYLNNLTHFIKRCGFLTV